MEEKLEPRCQFCGKPWIEEYSPCCSKVCKDRMEKLQEEWKKKDLCPFCGRKKYVDENGKKYGVCFDCGTSFRKHFEHIDELQKKIMEDLGR